MSDYLDAYTQAIVSQILEDNNFEVNQIDVPDFGILTQKDPVDHEPEGATTTTTDPRFQEISLEDIDSFLEQNQNENTKKKTKSNISLFESFLRNKHIEKNIEDLTAEELNEHFCKFLLSVKKRDGNEYEPSTLKGFMCSLDRYLKQKESTLRLTTGPEFEKCRRILDAKQKQLKTLGLGNKSRASDELTDSDIQKLYENKLLGTHAPQPLVNLLHLTFCLHFGMRGGKEQRDLKLGDICIGKDSDGQEFLYHDKERQTKTRQGQNPNDTKQIKTKVWAQEDKSRCPVHAFRIFQNKRPVKMNHDEAPFFLSINHTSNVQPNQLWFKDQPMGINHIYSLIKNMVASCPAITTHRKLTNHSVRKHLVQKLQDKGVENAQIMQISGHRNVASINSYSRLNEHQQKSISNVLSDTSGNTRYNQTASKPNMNELVPVSARSAFCNNTLQPSQPINYPQNVAALNAPSSTQLSTQTKLHSCFQGTTHIHGGTFNFVTYTGTSSENHAPSGFEPCKKKFRRILPLNISDSDTD